MSQKSRRFKLIMALSTSIVLGTMSGSPSSLSITVFVARILLTTPAILPSALWISSPSTTAWCRKIRPPEMRFCMMFLDASETARPPTPPTARIVLTFRSASLAQTRNMQNQVATPTLLSTVRMISASCEVAYFTSLGLPPLPASRWRPFRNLPTGPRTFGPTSLVGGSLTCWMYSAPWKAIQPKRMRLATKKKELSISSA
mmetsp:Transcript_73341/g.192296  ORF Transcript_73341/g.192296 Transcript_73341/m.192296 type:complete len:201 (+) Transcript_73341:524-1126(+)